MKSVLARHSTGIKDFQPQRLSKTPEQHTECVEQQFEKIIKMATKPSGTGDTAESALRLMLACSERRNRVRKDVTRAWCQREKQRSEQLLRAAQAQREALTKERKWGSISMRLLRAAHLVLAKVLSSDPD